MDEEQPIDKRQKFIENLRTEMIHRKKFKYEFKDIIGYIFCCVWIRKRSKMRQNKLLKKQVNYNFFKISI